MNAPRGASFIFYVFITRICSVLTPFAFFTVSGVSREQIRVTFYLYCSLKNIFPGFKMFCGSKAFFIPLIISSSAGVLF